MMLAEQLKKSILQAAIQGKLTDQKKEDGNAQDLYNQIQEEKQRLIKEKKIKKAKPLPKIEEDEIPFDIPENWMWVRLGEIIELQSGQDFPKIKYSDTDKEGIPYITGASCFTKNGVLENRWTMYPKCIAKRGDILLVCKGSGYGKITICNLQEVHIARQIMAIKQSEHLNLLYVELFWMARIKFIKENGQGLIPGISRDIVLNLLIPLPPLAEQKRIVETIQKYLAEIEQLEKDEEALAELQKAFPGKMKASILQQAIQGKLTDQRKEDGNAQDLNNQIQEEKQRLIKEKKIKKEKPLPEITADEIPFEIPGNWIWVRLNDIVGKTIKRGKSPTYSTTGNVLVFAQKCNTKPGKININLAKKLELSVLKKYPEEEFMQSGDIVINSTGNGTMGRVGFFTDKDNPDKLKIVPDSHVTTIRVLHDFVDSKYVFCYLKTLQPLLESSGDGSTNQKELKPHKIASLCFPLPPLAEQKRIVEKLDKLLPLCEA